MNNQPAKQTVLITGASGGIGCELAKLFANDHYNLVLVARTEAKLSELAAGLESQCGITAQPLVCDLSDPSGPQRIFDELQKQRTEIDILVNNAAYGKFGDFAQLPIEDAIAQIQLNIASLTVLTRLLLPHMIASKRGKVLNVASTAGFQPGPLMAVYYASKAYVISFSEAIANELQGTGISVTCLCPGPTDTGFQGRAGVEDSRLFKQFGPMEAKTVARDGYRALMKGKTLTISGFKNRVLAETVRVAPRKLATAISRWVAEKAE